MPYFNVTLSGTGIRLAMSDGADPAIGFFTTRRVRAPDTEQAGRHAVADTLQDWQGEGCFSRMNEGSVPAISVDRVRVLPLLEVMFKRKPRGYTFYRWDD